MTAPSSPSYRQPTKDKARRQSLTHAIALVTSRREAAAVVPGDHPERVRQALLRSEIAGDRSAGERCADKDLTSWRSFRAAALGSREPNEITVAYLAGPEPQNDLSVLLELGVRPENIWAFEVDEKAAAQGLVTLRELRTRGVKFIPASMEDYFIGSPRRFDIIYFDACGPFPSRNSQTARALATMFRHSALAPLGVLVSNFSRPDVSDPADLDRYSFLIAAYLFPKSFLEAEGGGMTDGAEAESYAFNLSPEELAECGDAPPPKDFVNEVRADFERYYGIFLTRSLMDLATIIAPMARLLSSDLWKIAFKDDLAAAVTRGKRFVMFNEAAFGGASHDDARETRVEEQAAAVRVLDTAAALEVEGVAKMAPAPPDGDWETDGDAIVGSDLYSLIWTLAACGFYPVGADFGPPPPDAVKLLKHWHGALLGKPAVQHVQDLRSLMAIYYAWRHDRALWSPAMRRIAEYPYRERMPFLCDVPTAELGFFPAFAQLAYPAHPNVRETQRFRYVAEGKSTPMFMDVIAFDECRYIHDWISALHLAPEDWDDLSAQLTFRFALDGIAKDKRWMGDDFLYGCHVVGESAAFPTAELVLREDLSPGLPI